MKTLVFTMILSGLLAAGATANPVKKPNTTPKASVEQQLADRLTVPKALRASRENSVVVVQFRLDERNRVKNPQIFTGDQSLNDELTQQLMNLRLVPTEPVAYVEQVYTARLRFRAPQHMGTLASR
ncbi:hypothetical protein FAES_2254 [Fibrella aestuarina BUZ 2]|uniref:TonB C-terminal domain-containing protein n=1 Tax=Fibrella aestuarina BUZ 2 TaxID=1166018 RepID=I0K810_9BACT|nr:hypothetical protein [Fibrella aestuarina]CCH00263.1 hypothetical protein FAES_2254 [Fibrella aestuarina BUZ 2]